MDYEFYKIKISVETPKFIYNAKQGRSFLMQMSEPYQFDITVRSDLFNESLMSAGILGELINQITKDLLEWVIKNDNKNN